MSEVTQRHLPPHFKGKEAIDHVVEAQTRGIISASETHGTEMPGHISAAADTARETALLLLLLWTVFDRLTLDFSLVIFFLGIFSCAWVLWRFGRSAWLAWSRLEQLHRIVSEEKWEIDHHREQEREELKALYAAKGFEGKLLEEVLDVLMADGDRLLRVMVEEELGLSLGKQEHPLKQGVGAALGALVAISVCLLSFVVLPSFGIILGALVVIGSAAALSATYEKNQLIRAIVWNLGLGVLAFGCLYFLLDFSLS